MLEDFLEKIKKLTPIQTSKQNYNNFSFKKKKDYKILKETKILHQKRKDLSKIQIIEYSILFIILNYFEIASKKLEELLKLHFINEINESLKNLIINNLSEGKDEEIINSKINSDFNKLIKEINENSNIRIITKTKTNNDVLELLDELIHDHKDQSNLKKIESLEQKLINNLDESSYSELIRLKSQLNGE